MPQMSPMNWLSISILFILIWILVKSMMNYFSFKTLSKKVSIKLKIFPW